MRFSLTLEGPTNQLTGSILYTAVLIWENGCGNDCIERFSKWNDIELIREVILFLKNRRHLIESLDLSQFESRHMITFITA